MTKKLSTFNQFVNEQMVISMPGTQVDPMQAMHGGLPDSAALAMSQTEPTIDSSDDEETSNYMFFQNMETISRHLAELASLDPEMIDNALCNGHDWAEDHMAVAKENIGQVAHFFLNMKK